MSASASASTDGSTTTVEAEIIWPTCLPIDTACLKAEEEREKKAEIEKRNAEQASANADTSSTGLVCTNDGFVAMVEEGSEITWAGLAIVKELALQFVPPNFSKAIDFAWKGLIGMGNWIGFVMASTYYLALELDFGADLCEFYGYGYLIIDELYVIVSFSDKGEDQNEG